MKKYLLVFLLLIFFLDVYGVHKYIGILLLFWILKWYSFELLQFYFPEIVLIFFGLTYVIFAAFNVQMDAPIVFAFTCLPYVVFKIGRKCISLWKSEREILIYISSTMVALSALVLYSVMSNLNEGIIGSRIANIKFYSRTDEVSELSATLVGLHIVPLMSFLPLYLFQRTGEFSKYFLVGSIFTSFAVVVTSLVATRSPIFILAILLLLNFYIGIKEAKSLKKLVTLLIFFVLVYSVSVFDFANFEMTSFLYERIVSDDLSDAGSRTVLWKEGIKSIFYYPTGGESKQIGYFHNLWLDLRYVGGVVPMLFMMIISLYFTVACYKVWNSAVFSIQFRSFLGSVYLSLFLMMFMEPVIEGSFIFFLYYIFFGGVLCSLKSVKHILG